MLAHIGEVITGNKRRGYHAPEAKVCALLFRTKATIPNFQHIRVIPVAGARIFFKAVLHVQDSDHASAPYLSIACHYFTPLVLDIAGGAPQVASTAGPIPGVAVAPFANAEHYRTFSGIKCVAHQGV